MAPRQLPPLPQYRRDAVTRRLCATTHLDESFARDVRREFTADRLKANGLPLGVNLVALVRHAEAAWRRLELRDRHLSFVLCGVAGALLGAVASLGQGSSAGVLGFLLLLVALFCCGAVLVCRAEHQARQAALEVYRGSRKSADLAPPVAAEVEDRLRELRRANVLPYDASFESTNPFVGSGRKIKEVVWESIDISRAADSPTGGKLTAKPFDAVDLHTYVAEEMADIVGLEGLRAQNRLYVNGLNALHLPDLLPDRLQRPAVRVPRQYVQSAVVQSGAGMRTYLSLEMVGEGGKIVVSMHLRARLLHPRLSWEVAAYVLPPLQHRFGTVGFLPLGGFEYWWSLLRFGMAHTWRGVWGAPGRAARRRGDQARYARELEKTRRSITKQHLAYDYGATDSLRNHCSDWGAMGHTERTDSRDTFLRLQQGVLIATERFLQDHNIDTGDFDRAQQVIATQTYNISGDITGNANIGSNGQINTYGQPGAAQGGN
ncbi:hypothetical protein LKL35_16235 [Streptomyces sp. ET3-23]|uniref:hypothetical protein n=1 Tax=Streptomyces sp. ET3-23 TaxID=2885643 RepID=UPI001D12FD6C|nr:hypothetical protein [Streptomyces sp. ET3-23]MCC2276949.1 hypothetical protein [Streptomyces sp. ET3-23]